MNVQQWRKIHRIRILLLYHRSVGFVSVKNASVDLMLTGHVHAGFVTMIATFANTLRGSSFMPKFSIPFIHLDAHSKLLPWANLLVILSAIFVIYKIFTATKLAKLFSNFIRNKILKKMLVKPVTFEELTIATGGYGISQIEICTGSPLIGKTLLDARLREHDISVLALEKDGQTIPNPPPATQFALSDKIICFGKLENIRKKLCYRTEYDGYA